MNDAVAQRANFADAHPALATEMVDFTTSAMAISPEKLPELLGPIILISPYILPTQTHGGLFLPDQVADANDFLTHMFQVIRVGPLAFMHPRLRGGAECTITKRKTNETGDEFVEVVKATTWAEGQDPPKRGDWVIPRRFGGTTMEFEGIAMRFCYDDDIMAKVPSPAGWKAYI